MYVRRVHHFSWDAHSVLRVPAPFVLPHSRLTVVMDVDVSLEPHSMELPAFRVVPLHQVA
jgi:hypothetical protein